MVISERDKKERAIEVKTREQQNNPELVIPAKAPAGAYHVEVYDNDIRIGHDKEKVQGRTLSGGVTHTVSNLRDKAVYARALGGTAYVRVVEAGARVESEPTREVTIEGGTVEVGSELDVQDRAGREIGKARLMDSSGVLVDPATDSTLSSQLSREIATWSAGTLPVSVSESNATGVGSFSVSVDTAASALPALTVPDGATLTVKAPGEGDPSPNDAAVLVDGNFSLAPGEALDLPVSDASDVSVSAASGTQTVMGITEA